MAKQTLKAIDPAKVAEELDSLFAAKATEISGAIDAALEQIKAIDTEAEEKKSAIRQTIKPLNDLYARATGKHYLSEPKTTSRKGGATTSKAGELTGDALKAKGNAAVAHLKKKAGEWVSGKELAAAIDYAYPAAAIDAVDTEEQVKREGPGRARVYMIKK